ncbi:hypothetical protein SH2C18_18020 [Clostridium sediminicola]
MSILITFVLFLSFNTYFFPASKWSLEYLLIKANRAFTFSSPSTALAYPNTITLSYLVENFSGTNFTSPTTENETLQL